MRIISGKYKGRRFSVPKSFKARPTTDLAKENLFNVLSNIIDWEDINTALDLFAGTGSVGLELASRGCKSVISVEKEPAHFSFINEVKAKLGANELKVLKTDSFKFIKNYQGKFDFIFADPPYDLQFFEEVPTRILEQDMLNEGGFFILEHPQNFDFSELPYFFDRRAYGSVNFSFFEKPRQEANQ